jgi:drug/metabolite transporter (DMT)-like permease
MSMEDGMDATTLAKPRALALPPPDLLLLGMTWGASFLFMRVAVQQVPPTVMVEVRLALGALVLLPALWRSRTLFPPKLWPKLALVSAINSAIPFLLFGWAAHSAPAGVSAISNAMVVLFAALVGFAFFGERIGLRRGIAIGTGLLGVVVLASGRTAGGAHIGMAVAAGVAASLMYGIGLHLVRRHLSGLPPAALASASLFASALLVLPFALADWPRQPVATQSWLAVAALGVLCTGFAYVLFYRLVEREGPGRTSTVTYLVPVFGVAWGWLLLGETPTPAMAVAALLILGSVAISQRG